MHHMNKIDTIVIGGGLAGLECAAILAKEGLGVLVLEQGESTGGYFQPFKRRGVVIDSSVHYIGSLDKGQFMERFFSYLDLMDRVGFVRMNPDSFDVVYIDGKSYPIAMEHGNFVDKLSDFFPEERVGLEAYADSIKRTAMLSVDSVRMGNGFSAESLQSVTKSVEVSISAFIKSERLKSILTGNSIIYCGESAVTPYYVHAMANNSYIESSWRVRGGAYKITEALSGIIMSYGGEVRCGANVKRIITENGCVSGVELESGERFYSKRVISTIHPSLTVGMLDGESGIKETYRRRVNQLHNSCSMFSLYLILKPNHMKYINSNLHIQGERPLMVAFQAPEGKGEFAEVVTLLTPMTIDEVGKWSQTTRGNRGDDYLEFKNRYSDILIERVEEVLPGFRESVDFSCSATPLTYRDYVKSPDGSIYGIMKDYKKPLSTFLPVKTKVGNLYLAGQSVNLHGVMGVTFTSLLTCSEIIGTGFINKMGL